MNNPAPKSAYNTPFMVRGDIDGFFGLAIDNLVQFLVISGLCLSPLIGISPEILFGHIFPGAAISLVVGNVFYAVQARRLATREGRRDVCALPYGINTPSVFAFIFLVMLPAKQLALQSGASPDEAGRIAWQAGLAACFGSGLIEFFGAFGAHWIRRFTPRAALLSTLAGIALTFISLSFLFRTYANPLIGLTTLVIILAVYFGGVKFKAGLPGGLVAVLIGTLLAWITGLAPVRSIQPDPVGLSLPIPVLGDLLEAFSSGHLLTYIAIIIPMGLFNVLGSLQNLESAEAAGDTYPCGPSLAVNGLGTMAASLFGSCFPTTIYIGHPGWKDMGARSGYSVLNAVFFSLVCFTGTLTLIQWAIPVDAGMAIVLWIGIVITAQAFQAVPSRHAPAVVMGLFPGIAAWGALTIKNSLRVAGYGQGPDAPAFSPDLIEAFNATDVWLHGALALEQGFIFTAMILSAMTVCIIERKFRQAALWTLLAAALSATGIMHGYAWTPADTVLSLKPATPWATAYLVMTLILFALPAVSRTKAGNETE